jgi:C1A family cysteine protease
MNRTRLSNLLIVAAVIAPMPGLAQVQFAPAVNAQIKIREASAPAAITSRLTTIRNLQKSQGHTGFEVSYTTAMDRDLNVLCGLKVPSDAAARAMAQMSVSSRMAAEEVSAIDAHIKLNPAFKLGTTVACSATASAFNWQTSGKVTPVRDQGQCGSCWVFGTIAAFESSWAIRNNQLLDCSEQDVLSCSATHPAGNGSGSCNGGWMEWVGKTLVFEGTGTEASKPYTASNGTCTTIARPYFASNWGFVSGTGQPTVAQLKAALCAHGVLSVGRRG